jgi:hypothetical protein
MKLLSEWEYLVKKMTLFFAILSTRHRPMTNICCVPLASAYADEPAGPNPGKDNNASAARFSLVSSSNLTSFDFGSFGFVV